MTTGNRYPDFYCIGAQKAGTTWLFENLRGNPAFWMPFLKEVDYFNYVHIPRQREWIKPFTYERCARQILHIANGEGWWANKPHERRTQAIARVARLLIDPIDDDWYANVYGAAPLEAIAGDITPEYSILPPEGMRHLASLNPMAKVIFMVRDPVSRDLSHVRMNLKGRDTVTEEDLRRAVGFADVYERSNYPKIITDWEALLPEGHFKVVFYDHIVSRPRELLVEVAAFLGVETAEKDWPRAGDTIHKGRERDIPEDLVTEVAARHKDTMLWMAERYPDPCAAWVEKYILPE